MNWATSTITELCTAEAANPNQTFDEYMKETHMLENPEVLDDELPDSFDQWICEQTRLDITKYAVEWGVASPFIVAKEYCEELGIE